MENAKLEEDEKSDIDIFGAKPKRIVKKYADNEFMAKQDETDEEMAQRLALLYSGRPTRNRTRVNRWQPLERQTSKRKKTLGGTEKKVEA